MLDNVKKFVENDFRGKNLNNNFSGYVLIYADWCGYCKKIKPEYEKLNDLFPSMIAAVDATSGKEDLIKTLDVPGFPTILIYKNGMHNGEYKGDRSFEALKEYHENNFEKIEKFGLITGTPKKSNMLMWIMIIILILVILSVIYYVSKNYKKMNLFGKPKRR